MARMISSVSSVLMAVITALALFLFITPLTAGKAEAESDTSQSQNVMFSTGSRKITGKYIIKKDTVLPEGTTLTVKNGGKLYIMPDAEFTINGTLKIASGGSMFVQGNVAVQDNGKISCTGRMKIQKTGYVALDGKLAVNKGGIVLGQGTLEVLDKFSDISCKGSVTAKIKAPEPIKKDGVTTIGGVIIVNREFDLPKEYGDGLDKATYSAYLRMKKDSGYDMAIVSGFRSYEKQRETFAYWESIDGFERADRYSAQPGHSEHQTGLAMDISSLKQSYGETPEGKWLAEHCWEYGFLLRYPKNSEPITGYIYEPWHVRYLGKSTAKLLHDSGLTLEEFLGVAP